ncbi:MAG TPA: hypothetical protein VF076_07600, partial [Acidimicrobiales bacterium]
PLRRADAHEGLRAEAGLVGVDEPGGLGRHARDIVVERGAERDACRAGAEGLQPRLVVADALGEQGDEPAGGQQLAAVAPMYDSRQNELAYRRVASIAARDPAAQDDVARALSAAAQQGPAAAADVAELTAISQRYESDLSLLGLSEDDRAGGLTPAGYTRRIGRSALTAALTAPLAAIGAVIHFVPYQLMKQIGKRPPEGMRATVKLLGCTALFTAVYSAIGIRLGRRHGTLAGVAGFLLGPLSGYVTVRWAERMDRLGGLARARAVMAERGHLAGDLEARRADIVARTEAVTRQASVPAPVPAAR